MRPRSVLYSLLLLMVAAVGAAGWVRAVRQGRQLDTLEHTRQRAEFLGRENTRLTAALADRLDRDAVAEEHRQRGVIEQAVAGLARLPFRRAVVYREIPRGDLPAVLNQKLSQQLPDAEFDHVALELSALGLIPAGMNLKKVYLDLLGEQIGAFYDQHTHELFTFSGHPLTNSQNQVVLAHELTHALQDQHFDLLKLPLETRGNDDRALAASALVEGDATLVMNSYLTSNITAAVLRDNLTGALTTDVRQLAAAPRYLRETLLFPYLQGLQFATSLELEGGRAAVARAFKEPPSSSSQIMHPEKYLAEPREEPVTIAFANTKILGGEPPVDNVLGEFTIQQMLAAWTKMPDRSPAFGVGWRGDRILVYGDAAAYSYVCRASWHDIPAAQAFCAAVEKGLKTRYRVETAAAGSSDPTTAEDVTFAAGTRHIRARRAGTETVLIDAQDARWFDALDREFGTAFILPTS